ncbi:FAD-dependent monooxygenase, partial [Streptomyces sp. NPDC102282]|uniref:FAD-dependent monooxygenase n=1 Tax=Streptomyces sp. NPDC102282 TaxID=3366154 RepID=UPI003806C21D
MPKGAIVVGAGPVGLMLAGELRLGGVDVVVYEKLPAPSGESRGLGFTGRTAEVLDQRGLLTRLGEFRWGKQGHFGGVRINFDQLEESHFGVMGLPQSRTEELLEEWVTGLGVPILRGHEVTGFTETADGVVVAFEGPEGPGEDTARYLVGSDGSKSVVRRLAGIDFPGLDATRGMYLADVVGADLRMRPIGERIPGGGMVLSVTLEPGIDRIVIHEPGIRPDHGAGTLTFAEVADAWQRMTGESIHHASARWMTALTNATGQAAEYRRGRVLLVGDAAHDHAPLGAQGLSVGVQDAANLGWKLAGVINGWAPEGL